MALITALIIGSLAILIGGGSLCLGLSGRNAAANRLGVAVSVLGGVPAAVAAARVLWTGEEASLRLDWSIPFGSFYLGLDGLSAFFALAITVVCMLAAIYGEGYLRAHLADKNLAVPWFFFNLLFASMLLVVTARNGILFLVAWEVMSLASFFLVMFEHERQEVRRAGWTYMVAMHLGTAALLVLFLMLGQGDLPLDFDCLAVPASAQAAGAAFVLALVGFGTKAGILPLHVWLPEAHPAAPSHVSAVMSGVMIKTGIYGLLRTLTFLGPPPTWWGWTLLGVGAASGIVGVLMALAQHDLKRLLAYHSVENIGIICLGLGLGVLGLSTGTPALAVLGLAGGLLHVWNHAIFKSLLFLGAGAVAHATGTRNVEHLGGLLKKMPTTGLTFVIAAAAISGLPPLNGFISELLIYVASFASIAGATGLSGAVVAGLVAVLALAMIGGLAAACFAKACGVVFLGEPRTLQAAAAHEVPGSMRLPMVALAALCVVVGLLGAVALQLVLPVVTGFLPVEARAEADSWSALAWGILCTVGLAGGGVILLAGALALLRQRLLAGRRVEATGTWDCGYAAPSARMQYTASSFAWPIVAMFRWLLRPAVHEHAPSGAFPAAASLESHGQDVFLQCVYRPLFLAVDWCSERLRWVQQGRNQLYVLYIALALLVLLAWKLGAGL